MDEEKESPVLACYGQLPLAFLIAIPVAIGIGILLTVTFLAAGQYTAGYGAAIVALIMLGGFLQTQLAMKNERIVLSNGRIRWTDWTGTLRADAPLSELVAGSFYAPRPFRSTSIRQVRLSSGNTIRWGSQIENDEELCQAIEKHTGPRRR